MLVLKVRRGEVVTIGQAYIKVKLISDAWVELGIEIPPDWAITRPPQEAALLNTAREALSSRVEPPKEDPDGA